MLKKLTQNVFLLTIYLFYSIEDYNNTNDNSKCDYVEISTSDIITSSTTCIGELYEIFVRKREFVKYQSQSGVIKVMLMFYDLQF